MEGRSGEDSGDPCWETEAREAEGSEIGGFKQRLSLLP